MTPLGRSRKGFLYAGPFPALAFFKIWAGTGPNPSSLAVVASLMLVFCVVVILLAHRWDKPTYFDWTVGVYFALISLALFVWPHSAGALLSRYSVTGIYLCFFCVAVFPTLFGMDPFTVQYAKKSTPPVLWQNPIFLKINRIMTYTWGAVFAVCSLLSLYPSVTTRALIPLAIILGFGIPFNLRYPDRYLKRLGLPGLAAMRKMAGETKPENPSASSRSPSETRQEGSPAQSKSCREDAQDHKTLERKESTMKILALNSSPRGGEESKTGLMLDHLVQGMREAGADVEVVELRKKTIRHCAGCFTCWTKTPGACIHKDDMSGELFPKFLKSDLVVYATPLYHFTVNATMKAFIERTLPILEPFLQQSDTNGTDHPLRKPFPKAVFVSVAGFPEMSVFDALSYWVRSVFSRKIGVLVGEIYRPGAESLTVPFYKDKAQKVLAAVVQAGREIVLSSKISDETLAEVTADFIGDKEPMRKMANLFWNNCIREGVTPKEFFEKGLMPRPDSIETYMMVLPLGFNPAGAGDTKAVLQFNFTGSVEGSCHFRIEDGAIAAFPGSAEKPNLVVNSPFDVWMDIITRKADGQQMFMAQKYQVQGDLMLLMRMKDLFGKK